VAADLSTPSLDMTRGKAGADRESGREGEVAVYREQRGLRRTAYGLTRTGFSEKDWTGH